MTGIKTYNSTKTSVAWAVALLIIAALPYYGVWNFELISFDDPEYVSKDQTCFR